MAMAETIFTKLDVNLWEMHSEKASGHKMVTITSKRILYINSILYTHSWGDRTGSTFYTSCILQPLVVDWIHPIKLLNSETILAHKGGDVNDPANYRPTTMTSRVTTIFHKILTARLTRGAILDPRQKAFVPLDGCADNVFLLDSIIRGTQC